MLTGMIPGALLILLPAVAIAQDFTANFWLARTSRSLTDCIAFDPQFTREHTLTVSDKYIGCWWTAKWQ